MDNIHLQWNTAIPKPLKSRLGLHFRYILAVHYNPWKLPKYGCHHIPDTQRDPYGVHIRGFLLYYHEHMKWKVKVGAKLGIRQ